MEFEKSAGLASDTGKQMTLQSVKATGSVNGLLLNMTVRQHYQNLTTTTLETVYTFPLGWGSTLMGLHAEIGGKRLAGAVIEKQEASLEYEKAIAEGDAPVMLEKNSDGLYTANLGNLKPQEEAVIEYSYSQLLHFEQGRIRICLPNTIAPRYGDAKKGGIQSHQSTKSDLLVEYPFSLSLLLIGEMAKASIECPSHQVKVTPSENTMTVELERDGFLDRDFILNLSNLQNQSFCSISADKQIGPEGHTVLASFCPVMEVAVEIAPINLKILVDCSGSMQGDSIDSAKRALHQVLSHLDIKDRFSYSKFGDQIEHGFSSLRQVNDFNIATASNLVSRTHANMGGTEIESALISTFHLEGTEKGTDVFLITDGEIWDVKAIIDAAKKSGHRIFAIGVGSTPAETLLRSLAEETGGACDLVSPNEDIEGAIVRMFHRLRLPKSSHIQIDWGDIAPLWTSEIPQTIFSGDTLHIFAGFASKTQSIPTLSFQQESNEQPLIAKANRIDQDDSSLLPRIGAAQRMQRLSQEDQLSLALSYQLVTDQTNLILVHVRATEDKATELPELLNIAQMQAAGWGGAGSVRYSDCDIQFSLACPSKSIDVDYSKYDLPRVFRMSRTETDLDPTICADAIPNSKTPLDKDSEYYEIPAFLRKQTAPQPENINSGLHFENIIALANQELDSEKNLARFLQQAETLELGKEVSYILARLNRFLSHETSWIVLLAWLLQSEINADWKEEAKDAIQTLANKLDPVTLNISLDLISRNKNKSLLTT